MSNERILQRVTSDLLQQATSAVSNEQILQRVTSDYTTSNKRQVNSQVVPSDSLQRAISATSNKQWVNLQPSKEERMKSYAAPKSEEDY